MVWHFIGVYIINRTLHDRLEIRNFSSRVEKYFTRSLRSLVKYLSTLEEKFRISARPCNILYEHEKIKFVSTSGHVIFCLLYRHRGNTRKTISWTNPLFAESCIIKYRSYARSYFSREIEKISSVYLYSECYSNKAYKILLKRCVIVL